MSKSPTPPSAEDPIWPVRRRYPRKNIIESELVTVDLGRQGRGLLIDIGEGGMQVQPYLPLRSGEASAVRFDIPRQEARFEGTAMVAWVDPGGRAGIRFLNVPEAAHAMLRHWLSTPEQTCLPPRPPASVPSTRAQAALASTGQASAEDDQPLDAQTVLKLVAERALSISGAQGVAIAMGDACGMVCRASVGKAPDVGVSVQSDSGLSGYCLRSSQVVQCDDTQTDPRVDPVACRELNLRSVLIIPILVGGRLMGLLEVLSSKSYAFDTRQRERLSRMAQLIATMIGGVDISEVIRPPSAAGPIEPPPQPAQPAPYFETPTPEGAPVKTAESNDTKAPRSTAQGCSVICDACGTENVEWATVCQQCDIPLPSVLTGAVPHASLAKPDTPLPADPLKVAQARKELRERQEEWELKRTRPTKTLLTILLIIALMPLIGVNPQRMFQRSRTPGEHRKVLNNNPTDSATPIQAASAPAEVARASLPPAEASSGPGSHIEDCKLIRKVNPLYPPTAAAGSEQTVLLGATVTKAGTLDRIHVLSGAPEFASAAITAVRQWRYQPYQVNGDPVDMDTAITIKFSPPKK